MTTLGNVSERGVIALPPDKTSEAATVAALPQAIHGRFVFT